MLYIVYNTDMNIHSLVTEHFRITPVQKAALKRLGINSIEDLLYHFPARYGDTAEAKNIESLLAGDTAVIFGKIGGLKASKGWKSHMTMADGYVEDETGRIHCVWFNQPYVAKMIPEGALVRIEGKVSQRRVKEGDRVVGLEGNGKSKNAVALPYNPTTLQPSSPEITPMTKTETPNIGGLYFSNPKIEVVEKLPIGVGDSLFGAGNEAHTLYPVYPESRGVSSSWIYHALSKIFKSGILETITEPIPEDILTKYHLPGIKTALVWIHTPLTHDDALSARKRFAFEEIFFIQLGKKRARKTYEEHPAFLVETDTRHVEEFVRRFPFQVTGAQSRAILNIVTDMKRHYPMSRLLEGDVGSGKTAVAAATAYAVMASRPVKDEPEEGDRVVGLEGKRKSQKTDTSTTLQPSNPTTLPIRRANLQIAYMCPTEILAIQHFESFIQYFSYMPIQIGLITGSGCRKFPSKVNPKGWTDISRAQLLKWVANGEVAVLIGTHALIQNSVSFKNLAYVIIDEQHRFGTAQRAKLVKKGEGISGSRPLGGNSSFPQPRVSGAPLSVSGVPPLNPIKGIGEESFDRRGANRISRAPAPHLLSMTATPIPRTLALTLFGDLDLTLLDESPAGRKPIITELVLPQDREATYEKIREQLAQGRQLYVICPRIDEPDPDKEAAIIAKSVKEEAKRLKESVFPHFNIGILHSKMKPSEKDDVMADFKSGTITILCATSVVEVGVNVPNATVIIIEGAERFGLAQLHQLRGRVMRSTHQAYCYAFTETSSAKSIERLKALQSAKNGFELAELDLSQRGAGQLSGSRQWGVSDIAMEALKNLKMVEAARTEATRLIEEDVTLNKYPLLNEKVEAHAKESHFE